MQLTNFANDTFQQTLKNLERALKDAFNKKSPKKFPQFKKKSKHDSFRYPQGIILDDFNDRRLDYVYFKITYRKAFGEIYWRELDKISQQVFQKASELGYLPVILEFCYD